MKEISTKYIRQTWTILDEVIQWRDIFKILKTEKDFFFFTGYYIYLFPIMGEIGSCHFGESIAFWHIFRESNPLLSHPLSLLIPPPLPLVILYNGIDRMIMIRYFDCGWNPKVCTFKWKLLSKTLLWGCLLYNLVLALSVLMKY